MVKKTSLSQELGYHDFFFIQSKMLPNAVSEKEIMNGKPYSQILQKKQQQQQTKQHEKQKITMLEINKQNG